MCCSFQSVLFVMVCDVMYEVMLFLVVALCDVMCEKTPAVDP